MRILITNDDGIHAPGICALYEALSERHEVFVVAPDGERSAVGHAITLSDPIKVRRRPFGSHLKHDAFAVAGTPADCVKLAVNCLLPEPPDLVVSGINLGANVGINVLYSGTVSAATEGAILGIKAIAISLDTLRSPAFCASALYALEVAEWFVSHEKECYALNVNVPNLPYHRIKGVKVTRQATFAYAERFDERTDPRGNTYFWQCLATMQDLPDTDCDVFWLKQGYVTVTPLRHDLTYLDRLDCLSPPVP